MRYARCGNADKVIIHHYDYIILTWHCITKQAFYGSHLDPNLESEVRRIRELHGKSYFLF